MEVFYLKRKCDLYWVKPHNSDTSIWKRGNMIKRILIKLLLTWVRFALFFVQLLSFNSALRCLAILHRQSRLKSFFSLFLDWACHLTEHDLRYSFLHVKLSTYSHAKADGKVIIRYDVRWSVKLMIDKD